MIKSRNLLSGIEIGANSAADQEAILGNSDFADCVLEIWLTEEKFLE